MTDLPADIKFRPMEPEDVKPALRIIRQHNVDDFNVARQSYKKDIHGQYVLTKGAKVIGMTGWRLIGTADRGYWLSWTYLDEAERGQGLGTGVLEGLLNVFAGMKARKVFLTVSDQDAGPGEQGLYAKAIGVYKKVGFTEEVRHADYYDRGEAAIIMGLRIDDSYDPDPTDPEIRCALLTDVDEIVETDDAYFIDWRFDEGAGSSPEDLEAMVNRVRKWRGRVVFAGVASDATSAQDLFGAVGFNEEGRLSDFYEDGVDEIHYRLDI